MDAVLYERRDRIGVLTLNRPDNRNSMTPELLDAFATAVAAARNWVGASVTRPVPEPVKSIAVLSSSVIWSTKSTAAAIPPSRYAR